MWIAASIIAIIVFVLIVAYKRGGTYQVINQNGTAEMTGTYAQCLQHKRSQEQYCKNYGVIGKSYRLKKTDF